MKGIYIIGSIAIYNDMPRGWVRGKYQPLWHLKVYKMWIDMWRRVYTELYYFGSLIHPSFQYLSNYVVWIESQPRFKEFCGACDKISWSIDKDSKYPGNKNYYPKYMTLILKSDNTKERNNRNGNPKPKQPVIGIPSDAIKKIILTVSMEYVSNYGFNPSAVGKCINKKRKSHKGYKWYRVNYKHNKRYRVNGGR